MEVEGSLKSNDELNKLHIYREQLKSKILDLDIAGLSVSKFSNIFCLLRRTQKNSSLHSSVDSTFSQSNWIKRIY